MNGKAANKQCTGSLYQLSKIAKRSKKLPRKIREKIYICTYVKRKLLKDINQNVHGYLEVMAWLSCISAHLVSRGTNSLCSGLSFHDIYIESLRRHSGSLQSKRQKICLLCSIINNFSLQGQSQVDLLPIIKDFGLFSFNTTHMYVVVTCICSCHLTLLASPCE